MSKAERLSQQIDRLEAEYLSQLRDALQKCAEGEWGMFGQNEHLGNSQSSGTLLKLRDTAAIINALRQRLGEPSYALHDEFEAARGRGDSNQLGEPRLAQAWLERLGASRSAATPLRTFHRATGSKLILTSDTLLFCSNIRDRPA